MDDFVVKREHVVRLLEKAGVTGDDPAEWLTVLDESGFLDDGGRVCVRTDVVPDWYIRETIDGSELDELFASYGVVGRDLELLRGRMIVEGNWAPEEVLIEDGHLSLFGEFETPDPAEVERDQARERAILAALTATSPFGAGANARTSYGALAAAIAIRLADHAQLTHGFVAGALAGVEPLPEETVEQVYRAIRESLGSETPSP